jgi:hypothetical protein
VQPFDKALNTVAMTLLAAEIVAVRVKGIGFRV